MRRNESQRPSVVMDSQLGPDLPITLTPSAGGIRFALKVVPGSSRDRIMGELGGALKVGVSKPPQDGAANKAVVALLASALDVPAAAVRIVRGTTSPRKEVEVSGLSAEELSAKLAEFCGNRT